jgi:D-lyxose ketol-isomerase
MITREQRDEAARGAHEYLRRAGIILTPEEMEKIEVADFGLSDLANTGLELVTYVNTQRCCAKELILFPGQTCPEHLHPSVDGEPGKEETFRCRWGTVYLYVDGEPTDSPSCAPPRGSEPHYQVRREVVLKPGDQFTIWPGVRHWFQAGSEGAVVSEFSTRSRDDSDVFTDPRIERETKIEE